MVAFAGGFLAVTLGYHAIIVFVIGVIVNIYTFVRNKKIIGCVTISPGCYFIITKVKS